MRNRKRNFISNNLYMLHIVMKIIPFYMIGRLLLTILGALVNAFVNIYLVKFVVDAIQNDTPYPMVFKFIIIAMFIYLIQKALEGIFKNIYLPKMTQILNYKMQITLFAKAKEMDIENYDKPDFYNDFIYSMSNADSKAIDVVNTCNTVVYNITSISAMIGLIASIDSIGLIFAIINVTAAYFLNIKTARINYQKNIELIPPRKVGDYVGRVFYLPEYAKEIRMSHIKRVLHKYFDSSVEENKDIIKKYSTPLAFLNFANYGFFRTFLMRGVYLIILVYKLAVTRSITFGSFLALFNGSWEFKNNLESIINTVPKMIENSLYIEKYRAFIDTESKIKKISGSNSLPDRIGKIEFRNVSFRYTDDSPYILKNINLTINPCEKLAIYGLNGAGKSTLIKLLLRLYLVTEGEILLDGKNINSYQLDEYYNYIGVIFQDFQLFAFSIAENILLDIYDAKDEKRVTDLLNNANFNNKLNQLNNGIQTLVSKEFDKKGMNFSGGERQKIAIARTMAKNYSILIYDEPASALDPISEYEVNKAIWESSNHKTVICISHRINTNVKADRTIYIKEGQIVDDAELKIIYQNL